MPRTITQVRCWPRAKSALPNAGALSFTQETPGFRLALSEGPITLAQSRLFVRAEREDCESEMSMMWRDESHPRSPTACSSLYQDYLPSWPSDESVSLFHFRISAARMPVLSLSYTTYRSNQLHSDPSPVWRFARILPDAIISSCGIRPTNIYASQNGFDQQRRSPN